jgi:hypothetical protein
MAKLKADAPTPRDPKCRDDYATMVQQMTIDRTWDWLCPKCGRRWPIPEKRLKFGEDE